MARCFSALRQGVQVRAQKFKKGGRNFLFTRLTKKKKGLHVFQRPIFPPKSSEDQKKKGQRVLRCPVSTVLLTVDIYQLMFQRGGRGPPPLDTLLVLGFGLD